jgi:tetratricopeptide (TPR) repeat protein
MFSFPGKQSRARLLRSVVPLRAEVPKLILLLVLTSLGFAGTRAIAGYARSQQLRDAASWRDRGQAALTQGQSDDAVAALRRAVAKDRGNRGYAVELASALAGDGNLQGAEQVLLDLRDQAPEDPELNLQLARLEVRRDAVDAALRYYRSALYAPWPDPAAPLQVRIELSEFLLDQQRSAAALSELIAALSQAPADAIGDRKRIAALLLRADDAGRALRTFEEVLDRAPQDGAAAAGAGSAAFALGRYALALQYFREAPPDAALADMRDVAARVVNGDPLATRLGRAERRRRITAILDGVTARLDTCRAGHGGGETGAAVTPLAAALTSARGSLASADRDSIEDTLAAAAAAERALMRVCGADSPADRALLIIAALHGGAP